MILVNLHEYSPLDDSGRASGMGHGSGESAGDEGLSSADAGSLNVLAKSGTRSKTATREQSSRATKAGHERARAERRSRPSGFSAFSSQAMTARDIDIADLRKRAHLSQEKLARLLGTSWVTISRWERNVVVPGGEASERLERLSQLVDRIAGAIPADRIFEFLDTPNPQFRGHPPMELLTSDYSFQDLLSFVDGAKSGEML
jgi:DNA-binding transcriptional regulator YiaG